METVAAVNVAHSEKYQWKTEQKCDDLIILCYDTQKVMDNVLGTW